MGFRVDGDHHPHHPAYTVSAISRVWNLFQTSFEEPEHGFLLFVALTLAPQASKGRSKEQLDLRQGGFRGRVSHGG